MTQTIFVAQNELEKKLLSLLDGSIEGEDFLHFLQDAQVYMPIQDEAHAIKGFQRSTKAQPLLVTDEDDNQVLILFTSPGHAKDFVQDYPGYSGGLLTEFSWLLRRMDTVLGIALNPGMETGFDLDAEMVANLMANLPPETQ